MKSIFLGALAMILLVPIASAQTQSLSNFDKNHDEFGVGASLGYFLPIDSKIQSIFGKEIFKFGVDLGPAPHDASYHFGPSLAVIHLSSGSQNVTVLAGMVSYEIPFSVQTKNIKPYLKLGAGGAYADYTFDYQSSHFGAKRILPAAQAKLGVVFDKNWELYAAYDWIGSTSGFNFSGLSVSLSYTVFRF